MHRRILVASAVLVPAVAWAGGHSHDHDGETFDTHGELIHHFEEACEKMIEFDHDARGQAIAPGADVSEAYAEWGVHIELFEDESMATSLPVYAFDTANPPVGMEHLGSPHVDFGGSGWGIGGAADGAAPNNHFMGNSVRSEEGKPSWYRLTFDEPMCVWGASFVDIGGFGAGTNNQDLGAQLLLYDHPEDPSESDWVFSTYADGFGTNGLQWVDTHGYCGVDAIMIDIYEEGAWDCLCLEEDDGSGAPIPRDGSTGDVLTLNSDPPTCSAAAAPGGAWSLLLLLVVGRRRFRA